MKYYFETLKIFSVRLYMEVHSSFQNKLDESSKIMYACFFCNVFKSRLYAMIVEESYIEIVRSILIMKH